MARGVQLEPYTPRPYSPEELRLAQIRGLEAELDFSEANCPDESVYRDQMRKELEKLRSKK